MVDGGNDCLLVQGFLVGEALGQFFLHLDRVGDARSFRELAQGLGVQKLARVVQGLQARLLQHPAPPGTREPRERGICVSDVLFHFFRGSHGQKQGVPLGVGELEVLAHDVVHILLDHAGKLGNAVVQVHHIVIHMQLLQKRGLWLFGFLALGIQNFQLIG